MHVMRPAMLALRADFHRCFFGLLRICRRASQREHFIRVIVFWFRGKIRPRETLNRMLSRWIKYPWRRKGLYTFESLISRQPVFLSCSMMFPSQGKSKQARAILLGEV